MSQIRQESDVGLCGCMCECGDGSRARERHGEKTGCVVRARDRGAGTDKSLKDIRFCVGSALLNLGPSGDGTSCHDKGEDLVSDESR